MNVQRCKLCGPDLDWRCTNDEQASPSDGAMLQEAAARGAQEKRDLEMVLAQERDARLTAQVC